MLARLLSALPSVRTARDLAVAEERIAHLERSLTEESERVAAYQMRLGEVYAKYDALVLARLFKQGDIASPILSQPKTPAPPATGPFGAFSRLAWAGNGTPPPEPVGDDAMS